MIAATQESLMESSYKRPRPMRRFKPNDRRQIIPCLLIVFAALSFRPYQLDINDRFRFLFVQALYDEDEEMTDHAMYHKELNVDFLALHRDRKDVLDLSDAANAGDMAGHALDVMTNSLYKRLSSLFGNAKTPECRAKIAQHLNYFVEALGQEKGLPFQDVIFPNECPEPVYDWDNLPEGITIGDIQNRSYQPPPEESEYIDDPANLRLCYGILTHDDAEATERLIDTLDEEGHWFIIHVDKKAASAQTYERLAFYASTRSWVHVLDNNQRVSINWGGFSMVNATMQILRYAFAVDEPEREALPFHKFVHLASTSYPLASRREIRKRIASYPLDANFVHVILKPTRPPPASWHYFVECDDSLHRIYRLHPLQNSTSGVELYTSSQWFIISREFAQYLAEAKPGSFVHEFLEYVEHVVVADETFFGTVLRHSKFCTKHHNENFLHLQFDRWESDLPEELRDPRKCMMPDPDHCGRSPTTMTIDYVDILELSDDLFARKFVDSGDSFVKDIVDEWRDKRDEKVDPPELINGLQFEGHGVLIVAKDTINDEDPLCMGLGETGNNIGLVPCFFEDVLPTLATDWATGAVIREEVLPHNRWEIGPCTTDGDLRREASAEMKVEKGSYSKTGPRCMLKQMDGPRTGRCFDGDSGELQPVGETQVFPCTKRWYQFLSFGDGRFAPNGSMFITIPSHIVSQIRNLGHKMTPYLCLGVYGRGNRDELDWEDDDYDPELENDDISDNDDDEEWAPLSEWLEQEIVTTQCTNKGAVIEWLFVPFITEDNEDDTDVGSVVNHEETPASKSHQKPADEQEGQKHEEL